MDLKGRIQDAAEAFRTGGEGTEDEVREAEAKAHAEDGSGAAEGADAKAQPAGKTAENGKAEQNFGRVEAVTGVVIEATFSDHLPEIYSALEIDMTEAHSKTGTTGDDDSKSEGGADADANISNESNTLVVEVQQHLGDDRVRCVAMDSTDGLARGMKVRDTGGPITVPVGKATLGRIFNLLGEPIDQGDDVDTEERWPIHRPAPDVEDLTPTREIFETGIKVVDLLAPLLARRQGRPVRRRRGGQDRADPGADPQHRPGARRAVGVLWRGRALA